MGAFVPPSVHLPDSTFAAALPFFVPLLRLHSARWLPHTSICFLLVFTDSVRVSFYLFIFLNPDPLGKCLAETSVSLYFASLWVRMAKKCSHRPSS